jgi:septal ring factor EnvC (AmiA/AmiB activator)
MPKQNRKFHSQLKAKTERLKMVEDNISQLESQLYQAELNLDRTRAIAEANPDDEAAAQQIIDLEKNISTLEIGIETTVQERDRLAPPEKSARERVARGRRSAE